MTSIEKDCFLLNLCTGGRACQTLRVHPSSVSGTSSHKLRNACRNVCNDARPFDVDASCTQPAHFTSAWQISEDIDFFTKPTWKLPKADLLQNDVYRLNICRWIPGTVDLIKKGRAKESHRSHVKQREATHLEGDQGGYTLGRYIH